MSESDDLHAGSDATNSESDEMVRNILWNSCAMRLNSTFLLTKHALQVGLFMDTMFVSDGNHRK